MSNLNDYKELKLEDIQDIPSPEIMTYVRSESFDRKYQIFYPDFQAKLRPLKEVERLVNEGHIIEYRFENYGVIDLTPEMFEKVIKTKFKEYYKEQSVIDRMRERLAILKLNVDDQTGNTPEIVESVAEQTSPNVEENNASENNGERARNNRRRGDK